MVRLIFAAASLALVAVPAAAAPCHDAKGKFIKCPEKVVVKKQCRDAKGKFIKCKV